MNTRKTMLAVGDGVAIASFAVIGLLSHNEGVTVEGVLRNAGPVLAGWTAAALIFRPYAREGAGPLLATWGTGVTAGVLARAVLLDRDLDASYATFWAITMGTTLALVGGWRAIARFIGRPARAGQAQGGRRP